MIWGINFMYRKLLLALFVLNLFAYLGCSTRVAKDVDNVSRVGTEQMRKDVDNVSRVSIEQMRKDVDKVFTKDEYVKVSELCLGRIKTGKEFGDCKDRIFFPKVQKYCSDNNLQLSDCNDFKKLVRQTELGYINEMKDTLRNRTEGNGS
jgi:hypothetical protein